MAKKKAKKKRDVTQILGANKNTRKLMRKVGGRPSDFDRGASSRGRPSDFDLRPPKKKRPGKKR